VKDEEVARTGEVGHQRRVVVGQVARAHDAVADARVPAPQELLDRVGPRLRDQQFELHAGQSSLAAPVLGERHELPAEAGATFLWCGDQHPELAEVVVELLDAHGADDAVT
jgi:hypothetical protein